MNDKSTTGSNFYMLTAQILNDKNLSHAEKLTMAILNGLADEDGKCYPSNEWIAEKLDLHPRKIQSLLENLEKNNYISREIISCVNNPFKKYRIIKVSTNFKLCLPDAENGVSGNAENGTLATPKTACIIDKKELIDKKEIYKKPPKSQKEASAAPQVSADADALCTFFFEKIRERNPEFKEPKLDKWRVEFDLILRVDKRDPGRVRDLILWASTHKWWKGACLSPSKLRKDYDIMATQMLSDSGNELVRKNRAYAMNLKEKYPEQMRSLSFDDKYAIHRAMAKEIPFHLPEETFKKALIEMFGGTYVRRD
jgi:DNA-binding Lrp family transcriptional regulator